MIRHASPAQPIDALAQTMIESPSLSLLVPAVGGVSLLAARSLSASGAAGALSSVTLAANPKETAATSCATKSHSKNGFGHGFAYNRKMACDSVHFFGPAIILLR
jgi:hypothetical protein